MKGSPFLHFPFIGTIMHNYILINYQEAGQTYCGRGCRCLEASWDAESEILRLDSAEEVADNIAEFESRNSGETYAIVLSLKSFMNEDDDAFDYNDYDMSVPSDLDSNHIPDEVEELLPDSRRKHGLSVK